MAEEAQQLSSVVVSQSQGKQKEDEMAIRNKSEQFLKDLTECAICLDTYDDPRVLPACAHRYCHGCLQGLATRFTIKCPECRAQSRIPPGGIDALPCDFIIKNLIDHLKNDGPNPSQHEVGKKDTETITNSKNSLLGLRMSKNTKSIHGRLSRSRKRRLRNQWNRRGLRNTINNVSLALTHPIGSMVSCLSNAFGRTWRMIRDFYFGISPSTTIYSLALFTILRQSNLFNVATLSNFNIPEVFLQTILEHDNGVPMQFLDTVRSSMVDI